VAKLQIASQNADVCPTIISFIVEASTAVLTWAARARGVGARAARRRGRSLSTACWAFSSACAVARSRSRGRSDSKCWREMGIASRIEQETGVAGSGTRLERW